MLPNVEVKQQLTDGDWRATPEPVRQYVIELEQTIAQLVNKVKTMEKRIEKLESRTNKNSQNSNKPPSSDSPFKKPKKKIKKRKRKKGAQKGHKGHKQELLEPTQEQSILPEKCDCGCSTIIPDSLEPYYTHQVIQGIFLESALATPTKMQIKDKITVRVAIFFIYYPLT